ncbi:FAD binding domain-containing protein [Globomyces pollinis-pini]|nr:FAD binding domain-containing protein [Globomyces pollinis-pini]
MLVDCDVLIIGGGPVGLTCAAELIRQGISSFQIVDKRLALDIKSTGTTVTPPTMEVLESYGLTKDLMMKYGYHGKMCNLLVGSPTKTLKQSYESVLQNHTKYPFFLGIEQWYTEKSLNNFINTKNHQVLRGYHITDLKDSGDVVLVDYFNVNDSPQTIHQIKVKFVIAADGARSPTRKRLGIKYEGSTNKRSCTLIHFKSDSFQFPENTLHISFEPKGGYFGMRLPNETMVCAIPLLEHEEAKWISDKVDNHDNQITLPIPDDEYLKMFKYRNIPITSLNNVIWKTHFRPHNRVASSYWNQNRIFLAGDAVHSSDPMAGLGLNYGIQDSANLGWKIAFVLKGYASRSLLETYETEMRPNGDVARQEGLISESNFKSKSNFMAKFIANVLIPVFYYTGLNDKMFLHSFNLDIHHKSKLTSERWAINWSLTSIWLAVRYLFMSRIKAGEKFKSSLHKLLPDSESFIKSTKFKVILFEGSDSVKNKQLHSIGKEILDSNRFVDNYQIITDSEKEMYARCGVIGECMMIIRPDHFIGLRCHAININHVNEYFSVLA